MYDAQLAELHAVFPEERVLFHYFKDRYALLLLSYFVGSEGKTISEIKQSALKGLLNKPLLKTVTKQCANGRLTATDLLNVWPENTLIYRLTLGAWGDKKRWRWQQTSRAGKNLVLQLNFSNRHNEPYYRLLKPVRPDSADQDHLFEFGSHPINQEEGQHTLAWARIDLNLDDGEALIEEIQNDWIREALVIEGIINAAAKRGVQRQILQRRWGFSPECLQRYMNEALKPHIKVWDEAMLTAAIWYLREEIGIGRIFYHSFEGGNQLKNLTWAHPPRSLYTKLPRRFGFAETAERPQFLERSFNRVQRKRVRQNAPLFYLLEL